MDTVTEEKGTSTAKTKTKKPAAHDSLKRSPSVLVMNKNALLPLAVCRFISLPLIQTKREGNRENKLARNLYD